MKAIKDGGDISMLETYLPSLARDTCQPIEQFTIGSAIAQMAKLGGPNLFLS